MLQLNKISAGNKICIKSVLVLLVLNLIQTNAIEPPDLTFVIKNSDTNSIEPVCFADGNVLNSAIGWIYPIVDTKDKLPKIVSNYVPDLHSDYDCNFAKTAPCRSVWVMEDWQQSKFDSHCFKPTLDTRWEAFPTLLTSNSTKEFILRENIPPVFQIGISIRATKNAEIFLCEGWHPHNYPCYYINIGSTDNKQAFLRKYKSIPEKFSKNDTKLAKYKSEVGILFEEEWKNFALSFDENGTIKLSEMNKNVTLLNYTDKQPVRPNYLFIRSKYEKSLWKIHYNQYIFTNKTGVRQLGPTFVLHGTNLCVSLYISLCNNCKMSFFLQKNGERIILKEVYNKDESNELIWKEIKLLKNNILDDKIQLFVETKYTSSTVLRNGFWAIDDVRICAENEIKVTRLLPQVDLSEAEKSHLSCQALNFPSWRPQQHISSSTSEDIKYNSSTPTSIRLSWKPISTNLYQEYYVVQYEGKDICTHEDPSVPRNKNREKSQGYVIGKSNDIVIQNLVPYTSYNITLWSLIQEKKKSYEMNTLPTVIPTKEELPRKFVKTIADTTVELEWGNPKCNETYGPLIYKVYIKNLDSIDSRIFTDIKTKYVVKNLQPFTNYSVEITTARELKYLNATNLSIRTINNFTTLPGIAPQVQNLELYATDKHSASLRFDLPTNIRGSPNVIQVQWCHPLYITGCQSDIRNLTRCKLWDNKYCVDIDNLTVGYDFAFLISLKNDKTHTFGDEATITGTAVERIPGKPSNITYNMTECDKSRDYCHLNISWVHPYEQNGTITSFDIILNETNYAAMENIIRSIHEVLRIPNKEYQPVYSYVVKYIPFNTPYKIAIRGRNDVYKGRFASIYMKTDDIGNHLNHTPIFVKNTNETFVFKLPELDWRLNSSTLTVVVQDYDISNTEISNDIIQLEIFDDENELCHDFGNTWVAKTMNISNDSPLIVVIGDGTSSYLPQLNKAVVNKRLKPNTEYCITFTLVHQYRNSETLAVYHEKHIFTEPTSMALPRHKDKEEKLEESTNVAAYLVPILFIILLLATGAWLSYRYMKRRKRNNDDHIYESMPFDDYLPDAVSNQTYDKLIHD